MLTRPCILRCTHLFVSSGEVQGYPTLTAVQTSTRRPRRYGTSERILENNEHEAWAARLQAVAAQLQGPIYFFWGTDWEDAPVINAARLQACLPAAVAYDWQAHAKAAGGGGGQGSIAAMFAGAAKRGGAANRAAARHYAGAYARDPDPHASAVCARAEEAAQCSCATAGQSAAEAATTTPHRAMRARDESRSPQEPQLDAAATKEAPGDDLGGVTASGARGPQAHAGAAPSATAHAQPGRRAAGESRAAADGGAQHAAVAAKRASRTTQSPASAKRQKGGGNGGTQLGLLRYFGTGD